MFTLFLRATLPLYFPDSFPPFLQSILPPVHRILLPCDPRLRLRLRLYLDSIRIYWQVLIPSPRLPLFPPFVIPGPQWPSALPLHTLYSLHPPLGRTAWSHNQGQVEKY
jgi:hypothetical protein